MANFVALLDACVFYPAQLRDLLLRVALSDAFKARWTDQIHDEWISSPLRDRPDIASERLSHTRELMNRSVPDCLVTEYEPFIEQLTLPDPDDRSGRQVDFDAAGLRRKRRICAGSDTCGPGVH